MQAVCNMVQVAYRCAYSHTCIVCTLRSLLCPNTTRYVKLYISINYQGALYLAVVSLN